MRSLVSLWFPDFPVERFIRAQIKAGRKPPPRGLPFALVERGRAGLRLAAVNAAARQFGLTRGMRLADARAQLPELLTEAHEPDADMASLLGLCRWMERYSPWVSPDAPDGLLLDITGIGHLFGGEARMITGMTSRLAQYGFSLRAGQGATIGAAWALARYDARDLASLPVEALRIDATAAKTLRRLGLKTVGALLAIPRAALARRFRGESLGENVLIRLDEMMGAREEPLNPLNPPSSLIVHRALMEPVIHAAGLENLLEGLAIALGQDLAREGKGALRLILKLFRSDGSRLNVPAGFSAPTHDAGHMLRILKPRLEDIDAGFGIDAMTLEARETAEAPVRQHGFLGDDSTLALEQLNDRVLNRHDAPFLVLEDAASHIPEHAETAKPCLTLRPGAAARVTSTARPLLIFEMPEPVAVVAAVPDGPPMRLTWRRVTRRIVKAQGPERLAPEWWRADRSARPRDYYVAEDVQGRRYWLYREGLYGEPDGPPPKWFVHGLSA
jgi:protein ImuB